MPRFASQIIMVSLILLLNAGCGSPPPEPAVVDIPGYEALREQFTGLDLSPARGRRIVLDPGHGGFFRGAVGPSGLTEADVNLGVALYLRGLLEWADAEVFMTRTADYDFLSPADSTLTSDLAFRSSFVDSLQPDVFLSLHHNSVASLDPTVNETQTYYPLGDDGASLDLARAIHRHLVLNLEISPAKILPGNFHVLRNATVPAVLGEPAMISHPVIEGRLTLAASQRLEAEAYFLGLLDYFSQGSPAWSGALLDTVTIAAEGPATVVRWTFFSEDTLHSPGPGPDPGTFHLTLNGDPTPFHVTEQGRTVNWFLTDPDLALPAVLELRGQNLLGRAAQVRRTVLSPAEARQVKLLLMPEDGSGGDNRFLAIRWTVRGNAPLPAGSFRSNTDLTLRTAGGSSGSGLFPVPGDELTRVEFVPDDPAVRPADCLTASADLPPPWQWRLLLCSDGGPAGPWTLKSMLPAGLPVGMADQNSPLIPHEPGQAVWVNAPGVLPLVDPDPANPDTARTIEADQRFWRTEPLVPGLRGKVILLDPAGGGSDPDGTGPLGTRGATLNLATALLARDLLEGCGAVVHLTRRGETALPAEEKVGLAGRVGADFFLTIGRNGQTDVLLASHHPGSETGRRWAETFLSGAGGLAGGTGPATAAPSYDYLLRHTACPALSVGFPDPQSAKQEMLLSRRGWQRAEARAVLLSLVFLFDEEDLPTHTIDVAAVIRELPGGPAPSTVDWAELDGNLLWSPLPPRYDPGRAGELSPDGSVNINSFQEPGLPALLDRHTLEIHAGGVSQLWLLEKSGSGFAARLMMQNP